MLFNLHLLLRLTARTVSARLSSSTRVASTLADISTHPGLTRRTRWALEGLMLSPGVPGWLIRDCLQDASKAHSARQRYTDALIVYEQTVYDWSVSRVTRVSTHNGEVTDLCLHTCSSRFL